MLLNVISFSKVFAKSRKKAAFNLMLQGGLFLILTRSISGKFSLRIAAIIELFIVAVSPISIFKKSWSIFKKFLAAICIFSPRAKSVSKAKSTPSITISERMKPFVALILKEFSSYSNCKNCKFLRLIIRELLFKV